MEKRSASVIIIGGGIMGCATAYTLAKHGMKDIIVLEKTDIAHGSSGRSGGGVRQSARDPREMPLILHAVRHIWPTLSEELGADVEYVQKGNLRLGRTAKNYEILTQRTEKGRKAGLDVRMLTGDEAREICPYISHKVTCASYCATDGHANPLKTTLAYYRKALSLGVTFITGVTVTGIRKVRGRARIVETDDGEYEGEHILLCAGFWSRAIANTVGIDIPMRRQDTEWLVTEMQPHMFDVMLGAADSDFYGRQTKHGSITMGALCGMEPWIAEKTRYESSSLTGPCISRGILRFFPVLKNCKVVRTWNGLTDVCKDGVPVLGSIEEVPGLTVAVGFCGHGFGISPAVALSLSEIILDGSSHTIDISRLHYDRFKAKDRVS